MARPAPEERLSVEEYLRREEGAYEKSEYVEGRLFLQSGTSDAHNRITVNLVVALELVTRDTSCQVYVNDMKVRALDRVFYYPDVAVVCHTSEDEVYFKRHPCLVIEVLSPTTEKVDRGEKFYNYRQIPTLETYVLVSQDKARVEVFRRAPEEKWVYEILEGNQMLRLSCPDIELPLSSIYRGATFSPFEEDGTTP